MVLSEWFLMGRTLASLQVEAMITAVGGSHNPPVAGSNPACPTAFEVQFLEFHDRLRP